MAEKQPAPAAKGETTPAGQVDVTYTGDKRFESGGVEIGPRYVGPRSFDLNTPVRMDVAEAESLRQMLDQYPNYKFKFADVTANAQQQEG